jgi:Asp-tRNA(Asn)/Glu-tRNA(Gln) amidotransferase A subunit family amidase
MRFAPAANFIGIPSISVPVGRNIQGLPLGLQLMGRPWQEATLLRCAAVLEQALWQRGASAATEQAPVVSAGGAPAVWLNPLTGASAGL